jgi:AcrR family transcriptional regulator
LNQENRQRILLGMLDAVGAEGYEHTSVQSAVERAGLYRQAFYDCFPGKLACYLEGLDMVVERIERRLLSSAATEPTWRGGVRAALATLLAVLEAEPDVGRALLVEVHAAGPAAVARRKGALEWAAGWVDRARREGTLSAPALASEAVVAGILSILHARLLARESDGFGTLLPELVYLAVLPYFGPDAAAAEMRAAKP